MIVWEISLIARAQNGNFWLTDILFYSNDLVNASRARDSDVGVEEVVAVRALTQY